MSYKDCVNSDLTECVPQERVGLSDSSASRWRIGQGIEHDEVVDSAVVSVEGDDDARGSELAGVRLAFIAQYIVKGALAMREQRPFGLKMRVLLTSENTGGVASVIMVYHQPGEGPPDYLHHSQEECIFIVEGTYEVVIGGLACTVSRAGRVANWPPPPQVTGCIQKR